jgi:hypothetical protein
VNDMQPETASSRQTAHRTPSHALRMGLSPPVK